MSKEIGWEWVHYPKISPLELWKKKRPYSYRYWTSVREGGHCMICCELCGKITRYIFDWWITSEIDEFKHTEWHCFNCMMRDIRQRKLRNEYQANKTLINKIIKETKRGSDQNNRTTSPVSCGHASGREEWTDGKRQGAEHHQDCSADQ